MWHHESYPVKGDVRSNPVIAVRLGTRGIILFAMSMQQTSKWCKHCKAQVLATRPGTNHILHLLLSIVTCGLWIVIWVLSAIKIGGWRCTRCGLK